MKNRFYTLALAPLLFVACNTPEASTPAPVAQKVEATTTIMETQPVVTSNTNVVKYVSKPIVIEQGMLHIDGFMGTLKPTLNSALKQDKTQEIAMGACTSMAMQMTNDYNNISPNAKVKRTALKYRNPANKPDSTDKNVMYRLQAVNDGKPVAVDMGGTYRVYKPLKMKQKCLLCHGDTTQISPKVQKMTQAKYPHDLATGFKLGEFRGTVVSEFQK
ncbi:MAG TPA: DUF3365 domain-containing protein [Campylobacterales bacterium]|nr:DUF3365 domain-containing protein [Campylobacterales bacterium]